jgi:hypothetical protein
MKMTLLPPWPRLAPAASSGKRKVHDPSAQSRPKRQCPDSKVHSLSSDGHPQPPSVTCSLPRIFYVVPLALQMGLSRSSTPSPGHTLPTDETLTRPRKDVYCERLAVERNWRRGRCSIQILNLQFIETLTHFAFPVLVTGSNDWTTRCRLKKLLVTFYQVSIGVYYVSRPPLLFSLGGFFLEVCGLVC